MNLKKAPFDCKHELVEELCRALLCYGGPACVWAAADDESVCGSTGLLFTMWAESPLSRVTHGAAPVGFEGPDMAELAPIPGQIMNK